MRLKNNKIYASTLFIFLMYSTCFGQNECKETSHSIFNYFLQQSDSIFFEIGSVTLMRSDSMLFNGINTYCTMDSKDDGYKYIFFKDKLLFKYETKNNQVNGLGYCYYPFLESVAIQGQFKDGKLDGMVFIQDRNGTMIEVMEFKNGIYKRHLFHFHSDNSKKSLKKMSKGRSENPLRNDEIIVVY